MRVPATWIWRQVPGWHVAALFCTGSNVASRGGDGVVDVGPTGIEPATYGSLQLQTHIIFSSVVWYDLWSP